MRLGNEPADPLGPDQATVHVIVAADRESGVVGVARGGGLVRGCDGVGVRAVRRLRVGAEIGVVGGARAATRDDGTIAGVPRHYRRGGSSRRCRAPAGVARLRGGGERVPDRRRDRQPFGEVDVTGARGAQCQRRVGKLELARGLGADRRRIRRRGAGRLAGGEPLHAGGDGLGAAHGAQIHVPSAGLDRAGRRRAAVGTRECNRVRHVIGTMLLDGPPAAAG